VCVYLTDLPERSLLLMAGICLPKFYVCDHALPFGLFCFSDDGVIVSGNHRSTRGVFFLRWCTTEEVSWYGLFGCYGEKQQQSETVLQVNQSYAQMSARVQLCDNKVSLQL